MQHISPLNSVPLAIEPLTVPYIIDNSLDSQDIPFYDIPYRHGLPSVDHALSLGQYFSTPTSLASFTQSWLFFGLLRAFLRHPVCKEDFVSDGVIKLDQDVVDNHFRKWKNELWPASYAVKRKIQKRLEAMVHYALAKCEILEEVAEIHNLISPEFAKVALSVKLLTGMLLLILDETFSKTSGAWAPWSLKTGKFLGRKLRRRFNPWHGLQPRFIETDYISGMKTKDLIRTLYGERTMPPPIPPGDLGAGPAATLLLQRFRENGWCPFRARQLCQNFDYMTVNKLAALAKPRNGDEDHDQCLGLNRCVANDVIGMNATSSYDFRHDLAGGCDKHCGFTGIPYDELAQLILSDAKPIISVNIEGELDLKVIRCTPYTTYTAISHVWSHGRGNPSQNALPTCQILWLRDHIRKTYYAEYSPFYDDQDILRSEMSFALQVGLRTGRPHTTISKKRIYFWMDTLCIPVCPEVDTSEATRDVRFRAIKQITPIFVGAYNTLVLDRDLEDAKLMSTVAAADLSGDDFASYVMGCTWMERGWTLQEGSLSHSCVVLFMDKPFEMSLALRHMMPEAEDSDSPLDRAVIRIRRSMPLNIRRQLSEFKRQVMLEPFYPKAKRLSRLLDVPLFIWTWNSLINRSLTRTGDAVLIFASSLDFDVYQLRDVPRNQRLMRILQGCNKLPLSLLYNTGPRVHINGHPEMSWLPEDVSGDSLVPGGVLIKLKQKQRQGTGKFVQYRLDLSHNLQPETFHAFTTAAGQNIPPGVSSVHLVHCGSYITRQSSVEYMVTIQKRITANPIISTPTTLGHIVILDLACGSPTRRGFVGRGVLLRIVARRQGQWIVDYEAAVIARTVSQWLHWAERTPIPENSIAMERLDYSARIIMAYESSLWEGHMIKRPLYTMYPAWATVVSIIAWLVVFFIIVYIAGNIVLALRNAGWFPDGPFQLGRIVLVATYPFLVAFVVSPIRRRLSMFGYIAWLKSYDEPASYVPTQRTTSLQIVQNIMWRMERGYRYVKHKVCSLWQLGQGGLDRNDLPGDIRLE